MSRKKIAVAVSGGVDSLFALLTLHEEGRAHDYDVIALHGLFLPSADSVSVASPALAHLVALCQSLGISFHSVDLRDAFDRLVVEPFVMTYAQGRTPNPCALCNARIKFGLLWDAAHALGADMLATGHYASLVKDDAGHVLLSKAADGYKDQSYFLALVPKERLASVLFPLASYLKKDIIDDVQRRGLAFPVPKESQEVCFVPGDAYRPFLEEQAKQRAVLLGQEGDMLAQESPNAPERLVGRHKGLWQYTEGQRKGLGISWPVPLYVAARDVARNVLLVSPQVSLRGCAVHELNFFLPFEQWPKELFVRVRHRQQAMPASVVHKDHALLIDFHEAQQATACGQLAAVYDMHGRVLAGGIISQCFA